MLPEFDPLPLSVTVSFSVFVPLIGGVAQPQIGYRYQGGQDEPESVFLMLRSGIDATGNCVSAIILEPV
jgi:hypothetical protein